VSKQGSDYTPKPGKDGSAERADHAENPPKFRQTALSGPISPEMNENWFTFRQSRA
jgi:hypothetical protein